MKIKTEKGFTLIELLVVVAIVSIISAIGIPNLFDILPKIRVNGATDNLLTDMLWAKMKAVSENEDYVVAFGSNGPDLSNNTYYIYKDSDNNFSSNGGEADELVKTVNVATQYKKILFGYVAVDGAGTTIRKTNNSTSFSALTDSNAVTFSSGGATKPKWFRFAPNSLPNILGTVYLVPEDDIDTKRTDRMRAVSVAITGRVKKWEYSSQWD